MSKPKIPATKVSLAKDSKSPRILFFDIETAPIKALVWSAYPEGRVAKVLQDWQLLSVAWSWNGSKKIESMIRPDFRDKTDKTITKEFLKVINEADYLVAHNLMGFDKKKVNAKVFEHRLHRPKPYHATDTLKISRQHFGFTSHRLEDIARKLGFGQKVKHSGIDLWDDCMMNDPEAWKIMERYNRQDIVLLKAFYKELDEQGWLDNSPGAKTLDTKPEECPECNGKRIKSKGWKHYKDHSRRCFICLGCGEYFQVKV